MKLTTLIPTLALLCVATIGRFVSATEVTPAEAPKVENIVAGTTAATTENLGTNWLGRDAQGNPIYVSNRVTPGIEGAIYMGKDAQGNPIYAGNKVNYGIEGATMMMVSRNALFNMVASTCEAMAMNNPMMADWMQRVGQNIEVANVCSVQVMKNWWDALCGEYSMAKQHSFRPGN